MPSSRRNCAVPRRRRRVPPNTIITTTMVTLPRQPPSRARKSRSSRARCRNSRATWPSLVAKEPLWWLLLLRQVMSRRRSRNSRSRTKSSKPNSKSWKAKRLTERFLPLQQLRLPTKLRLLGHRHRHLRHLRRPRHLPEPVHHHRLAHRHLLEHLVRLELHLLLAWHRHVPRSRSSTPLSNCVSSIGPNFRMAKLLEPFGTRKFPRTTSLSMRRSWKRCLR
mmetsp:Transcript_29058/g.73026  ORF Transcript_29058/g.73026 Transcript_29058/m.73026 type:complete len:221 (+) Transcript_29058:1654-2316(+)